jgi:hypothetical protein
MGYVAIVAMFLAFIVWQHGANGGPDHPAMKSVHFQGPVLMELPEPANTTTVAKTSRSLR